MKGTAILCGLLASTASAHMQMSKPYPIRSPLNKNADGKKDYSYTNPLAPSGEDYPCKGYANDPFDSQATYQPGSSQELELEGSATHDGGSCQISLSYDKGKSFKVIESMLGDCPIAKKYNFKIPSDAPSGDALLAWSWFNKVGNREMYMNCAQVTIGGSSGGSSGNNQTVSSQAANNQKADGKKETEPKEVSHPPMEMQEMEHPHEHQRREMEKQGSFSSLPDMFIANVNQEGKCTTIEGEAVDFPKPGDNVVGKTDGKGKGYKCSGSASFLGNNNGSSDKGNDKDSDKDSDKGDDKGNDKNNDKGNDNGSSDKDGGKDSNKDSNNSDTPFVASNTANDKSMSKIASAFGSPSGNPRIMSTEATTNNHYANYVGGFRCVDGEILCSPDGDSWAMCSNGFPVYMGSVAAGMSCRFGQMVRAGY